MLQIPEPLDLSPKLQGQQDGMLRIPRSGDHSLLPVGRDASELQSPGPTDGLVIEMSNRENVLDAPQRGAIQPDVSAPTAHETCRCGLSPRNPAVHSPMVDMNREVEEDELSAGSMSESAIDDPMVAVAH